MNTNVYNIVWADDEIDAILDEVIVDLKENGFNIVGTAHDGKELEERLSKPELIDAVIVDANFNESIDTVAHDRDTSGLDYARGLYMHKLKRSIPFFLYTGRNDELLKDIYKDKPSFQEDFKRHERWFRKSIPGEFEEMLEKIKNAVDQLKSPHYIIRNKYTEIIEASSKVEGAKDFVYDFLINDYNGSLENIKEPFVTVRRIIEKIFGECEKRKLIPPISDNTTGTAKYFFYKEFSIKQSDTKEWTKLYEMVGELMPRPLAKSLIFIVEIVQDGAHCKNDLKFDVHKYYNDSKDTLLLHSVVFILFDIIRWFAKTIDFHMLNEADEKPLWKKCEDNDKKNHTVQKGCTDGDYLCNIKLNKQDNNFKYNKYMNNIYNNESDNMVNNMENNMESEKMCGGKVPTRENLAKYESLMAEFDNCESDDLDLKNKLYNKAQKYRDQYDWSSVVFEENGKEGLKTVFGDVVVPAVYEQIVCFPYYFYLTSLAIVAKKNGRLGLLKLNDDMSEVAEITGFEFDAAFHIEFTEFVAVRKEYTGKWGLVDMKGNMLVPTEMDMIYNDAANGCIFVDKDGKSGVYDYVNEAFAYPKYESIDGMGEGDYLRFTKDGQEGYVTTDGQFLLCSVVDEGIDDDHDFISDHLG